jgi:regulatory protein
VSEARELALRALRHRDHSRRDLDRRLERAGIPTGERERTLDALRDAGLQSDVRFAEARARSLIERCAGDDLVRRDLALHGIEEEVVTDVLAELPPEVERAELAFARRGGDGKALRYLAAKGFGADSLERLACELPTQ